MVKGALFARYSRTDKSLRRVFLDEFYSQPDIGIQAIAESSAGESGAPDTRRAERLYERVLGEYGDDSVAQLGGAHVACEQASNILTKVLEWGRLAAYLEQSTRYIYYDRKLGGRYRYLVPPEIRGSDHEGRYREEMDRQFETYSVHRPAPNRVLCRQIPSRRRRQHARMESDHSGEGLRYGERAAPCRDVIECRNIRNRSGLRITAAAHARQPVGRGPRLLFAPAPRTKDRNTCVRSASRRARPGRSVERLLTPDSGFHGRDRTGT